MADRLPMGYDPAILALLTQQQQGGQQQ